MLAEGGRLCRQATWLVEQSSLLMNEFVLLAFVDCRSLSSLSCSEFCFCSQFDNDWPIYSFPADNYWSLR